MDNDPKETVMNPIRRIRRIAAVLASLAAGLAAFATPAFASVPHPGAGYTPVFARPVPPPGTEFKPSAPVPAPVRTVTHTFILGGMPGWQIALIAVGAALLAAAVAVLAYRALATRRKTVTAAAA
jgi:hypothetical protein